MTQTKWYKSAPRFRTEQGPIVVGGVGGSGTRIVVEIMRQLGVYTGSELNRAGDNKWFTLLCKLPRFDLDEASPDAALVARSLDLLERAMRGQLSPRKDLRPILEVVERCLSVERAQPLPDDRPPDWLRDIAATVGRSRRTVPRGAPLWGWKEPNSHLFLPHLLRQFDERLRYVHVIRNGVYMAHSRNQAQVIRWGRLFGVVVDDATPTPQQSLDYWLAANELAVERGRAMQPGNFLLFNHDDLCRDPRRHVPKLVEFLGFHPPGSVMEQLVALPHPPASTKLTLGEMESEFGPDRLTRVRGLGFSLEDAA